MTVLVFLNVVLRYVFSSGILWGEEVTRILFVWTICIGAVMALKDRSHISVDMFVKKLPITVRKTIFYINNTLMLAVLICVMIGSYQISMDNLSNKAPVTGLPYAVLYLSGLFLSVGMIGILLKFYTSSEEEILANNQQELD